MKKRIAIFFLTILALALISAFFFPAGTSPKARAFNRTRFYLHELHTCLSEYAKNNGHYPDDLSIFQDVHSGEWASYLDPARVLYCKPETNTPPANFVLLIRLLKDKAFVVFADGTIKLITEKGVGTVYPVKRDELCEMSDAFYTDHHRFPYSRDELISYAMTRSNLTFSSERYAEIKFSNDLTNGCFEVRYTLTNNLGGGHYGRQVSKPQKEIKESNKSGDPPNAHSPSAQGTGGR
ncbi:MAG TPA: hypothetical protein PK251_15480 [Candidatus Latescibacteria bacterium]|jgi:hypothetical protein|nr:hypothetical protein [Candidatus Latescibacterota bacterium]HRT28384.1 hypothetical protein [Kiritimatiellia bacterium]